MPEDYGLLAMIFIFNDFATMFVDMGMANALIRKQRCTKTDCSTVFVTNICVSVIIYVVLFLTAPLVAKFYNQELLVPIIRIVGLSFICNALYSISSVLLTKKMAFNDKAKISVISAFCSAVIGISLAYNGFGVWSLVVQILIVSIINCILNFYYSKYKINFRFSYSVFKELFGFGSNVLGANLLFVAYQNIYSVLIGKFYNPNDVGYFTRADGYSKLIPINISTVLMKIMFPMISTIQDDDKELIIYNQKIIKITSFLIIPSALLLAAIASPLIQVMLTEKWMNCVPLLQVLSIGIMLEHICWINWDFIMVKGYSGLVLKNRILACTVSVALLLCAFPFGLIWVAVAKGIGTLFSVLISMKYLNGVLPGCFVGVSKTLSKIFVVASVMAVIAWGMFLFLPYHIWSIIVVCLLSVGFYFLISRYIIKNEYNLFWGLFNLKKN